MAWPKRLDTAKLKWPHNSEIYMTVREIRSELPKLNFAHTFHIRKPVKPSNPEV